MFSRQTDADRERRRVDLINRAHLVRAHGWDDYRAIWSTGKVVGVAVCLAITTYSPSSTRVQTAWARWAFDLWGLADGQADVDDNYRETRRWFIDTAAAM